jgi:predicted homoserine dehydrogenase-like protein
MGAGMIGAGPMTTILIALVISFLTTLVVLASKVRRTVARSSGKVVHLERDHVAKQNHLWGGENARIRLVT